MSFERRTMISSVGLTLILAALVMPSLAAAQEEPPAQHEISGEALPKYYMIQAFLAEGHSVHEKSLDRGNTGSRSRLHQFLGEVGLRHDASNEAVAVVAFQCAAVELQEKTFDFSLLDQPVAFRADQDARLKVRARRIGEIYGELLALYLESGVSLEEVAAADERIDAKYRPRISLHWMGEPGLSYLAREREFEMGVNRYFNTENLTGWVF